MRKNPKAMIITSLGLITLVFAGLLKLGLWQLERADQQRQYFKQVVMRKAQPHQPIFQLIARQRPSQGSDPIAPPALSQLPVKAVGRLLHQFTFLLDNVTHNGRVGYQVIVPLLIDDYAQQLLLVNLGWLASTGYRDQLPALTQWPGMIEIRGNLHQPSHNPYALLWPATTTWPRVIGQLDIEEISAQLSAQMSKVTVFPAVLRLDKSLELGYQKKWFWVNVSVEKHIAYAMQWFALAATLAILTYLFYRRLRTKESL